MLIYSSQKGLKKNWSHEAKKMKQDDVPNCFTYLFSHETCNPKHPRCIQFRQESSRFHGALEVFHARGGEFDLDGPHAPGFAAGDAKRQEPVESWKVEGGSWWQLVESCGTILSTLEKLPFLKLTAILHLKIGPFASKRSRIVSYSNHTVSFGKGNSVLKGGGCLTTRQKWICDLLGFFIVLLLSMKFVLNFEVFENGGKDEV